jgi:hypothetical protein
MSLTPGGSPPSLSSDVTAWARRCLACQRDKIHRHTRPIPLPIPIPQWRFSHLHADLVGPLQYSNSFNYTFTIIDRTSKWMEAIPLSEMSAAVCAKALTFTWTSRFGVFGVPKTFTSDHGPQFTSNLWFQLCQMLNILHKQTTAYHPESNGAVKRVRKVRKSQKRLPSLKNPEPQESGRLADYKSQDPGEQLLTIFLYSLQQEEEK